MLENEDDLSDAVVEFLSNYGHVSKVESKLTSAGIPDINFQGTNNHEWLELKVVRIGEKQIGIRPTQYKWFRERVKAGGKPFLLVYVQETGMYYIVPGYRVWTPTKKLESVTQLGQMAVLQSNSLGFVLGGFIYPPVKIDATR